jgi:release factor glutamine methyltransferase
MTDFPAPRAGEVKTRSVEGEGDREGRDGGVPARSPSPSAYCASTSPASRAGFSAVSRARLISDGAARLRAAGIENPRLEARLLLAHALGVPVAALLRDPHVPAEPTAYVALVSRRSAHEPLAYILGHREFWSLRFAVSPTTLIPRPESETLIEAALAAFAGRGPPDRILDLGTGTGCLLLSALHEFPIAFGLGVDRSPAAAELAAANARMLCLADRAAFLCADWAEAIAGGFDLILCNPPYIPTSEIGGLMPEVAGHEPASALDGGADGMATYRRIIPLLPRLLRPDGVAVLELGIGQGPQVAALAREAGLCATTRPDLAGIPRALVLESAMEAKKPFGTKASAD